MNYINDFIQIFQEHMKINNSVLSRDVILTYILPILSLLLVINSSIWRYSGYISTIFHEVGHAVAALTVFSRIKGIKINGDHSGVTQYLSSGFLPFKIWSAFWGYPFPSVVGTVYVVTALNGWSGVSLTLTLLLSIFISLTVRNFIALITIWGTLICVALIWWFLPVNFITVIIYTLGWFLIFSGVKNIFELHNITYSKSKEATDIIDLRGMTLIPATVWLLIYHLINVASIIYSIYTILNTP